MSLTNNQIAFKKRGFQVNPYNGRVGIYTVSRYSYRITVFILPKIKKLPRKFLGGISYRAGNGEEVDPEELQAEANFYEDFVDVKISVPCITWSIETSL